MIPIRVPADAKLGLISERHFTMGQDHPLYYCPCPVCDEKLGDVDSVLVLVGIEQEQRKESGFVIGGAVCVHSKCAQ